MLIQSDFILKVNPSKDFLKLVLVVDGIAMYALCQSSLPSIIIVFGAVGILLNFGRSVTHYLSDQATLRHQAGGWSIVHHQRQYGPYESLCVEFDAGFFMLLKFQTNHHKKRVMIFHDQMTEAAHKHLRLMMLYFARAQISVF